ncbi:MAG: hypothetical protein R2752_01845 [Vicinamibacterales bacterium]
MTSRTAVISAVAAGCIAAAGAGGFYAVRLASAPRPADSEFMDLAQAQPASTAGAESATTDARAAAAASGESVEAAPAAATAPPARTTPRPQEPEPAPPQVAPRPSSNRPAAQAEPAGAPARRPEAPRPAAATAPPVSVPALPPAVTLDPDAAAATNVPLPPPLPPAAPEPPRFVELVVPEDAVIGLRLDSQISTETAEVEDPVVAHVTRDVLVDDRIAIPADARLEGNVISVERGGKFRERARLGIRFTTLVLGGTTRVRIDTDAIYRDGESPAGDATAKIGASAVVGSILGAVIGGKKGAAIGGAAGAAGGTAVVMKGDGKDVVFAAGAPLTVRLSKPVSILVEREQQ